MNIFATDYCPEVSARNLLNRHSVKMPLESLGMLCFAFPDGSTPYPNSNKHRHYKHPASVWCRQTEDNFNWLYQHFLVQLDEYKVRYKRDHFAFQFIDWFKRNKSSVDFAQSGLTPFARCFSQFKQQLDSTVPDAVDAYREFYWLDKRDFAKWPSVSKIPNWWQDRSDKFVDKSFKDGVYIKR